MKNELPEKHLDTINLIAQYIYDNVENALSLDFLAEKFSVSKYHLNRLFFTQTGMNLGEFTQRRRMELAYELIRSQDMSVIDAALHVGYGSPASFSRAFSKLFGIEPNKVKLKRTPQFALASLVKKPERQQLTAEMLDLPEQCLQGLYGKGFHQQTYFKVAQQLYAEIAEHLKLSQGFDFEQQPLIGISLESPWRTEQTESQFFAGIKLVDGCNNRHPALESHVLAAGRWARFEHFGPYNTMWQTILNIYANWTEHHTGKLRDGAIVQHYVNDISRTPMKELLTHLYFPVENNT